MKNVVISECSHVVLVRNDVSEERICSVFMVKNQRTNNTLAVAITCSTF
jgi:hypothetical protein